MALVEAMDLSSTKNWTPAPDKYSNRVVSLTPASMRFFNGKAARLCKGSLGIAKLQFDCLRIDIGVTEQLTAERVHPYSKMRVWDGVTNAKIEFDTRLLTQFGIDTQSSSSAIAYMIENVHLQHAILRQLDGTQGRRGASVDIFEKARVESITLDDKSNQADDEGLDLSDWPRVTLANGSSLKARLLVSSSSRRRTTVSSRLTLTR